MTDRLQISPDLLEVRPYSHRNGHVVVEVSYAGVVMGDIYVPERSTLEVYDELARATIKREWSQLSAHRQMSILDAGREQAALRELEGVTYLSISDESGKMDDELYDMLSEGGSEPTPQQS